MKTTKLGFMARDQYGQTYHFPGAEHPRKALLDHFGRQHVAKMYVDTKAGVAKHIGYIVAGLWLTVLEVHEWGGRS